MVERVKLPGAPFHSEADATGNVVAATGDEVALPCAPTYSR